jgi:hypothetical protein
MTLSREELRTIHPHRYYGFKCGLWVTYKRSEGYMFLGYKDKEEAVLAIGFTGDKITVHLDEIGSPSIDLTH